MAGSTAAAINGITSMFKSWINPDLSGWEKMSATLMGISMIIPSVMSMLRGYGTLISFITTKYAA
jgi:hypothetical protein